MPPTEMMPGAPKVADPPPTVVVVALVPLWVVRLVGLSIQSRAKVQTSSAALICAPNTRIKLSLPATICSKTDFPDFDGPDTETTIPGVSRASLT